ncbi:MAG: hypothetical protein KDA42_01505 [Planctomycetales bacterium]|nr:hypothetical protein [Planctomycetales bacterium]
MNGLDAVDIGLLAIGAYLAVAVLVRLMSVKRKELTDRLHDEIRGEQARIKAEEKKRKKDEARRARRGDRAA